MSAKAYEALSKSNELTPVSETAQSPEQRNDDEKERKKRIRGTLIKFGSLAVFAFIVWVFATIAWFSSNSSVSGNGMGVSVAGIPFELAATGDVPQAYIDLFEMADDSYHAGAKQGNTNEYRTGTDNKIFLRFDPNDTDYTSSYTDGLRPGASGTIEFDIVPYTDETFNVTCYFSLKTFDATYDDQTNEVETITPIPEEVPANNTNTDLPDLVTASNYLRGHILFFDDRTMSGSNEIYSGYIAPDEGLTVSVSNGEKTTVTVYWKWVNTFDQMIYKSTDSTTDSPLFANDNNDDRAAVISYINENYQNILAGISSANATALANLTVGTVGDLTSSMMDDLNENYNTADQIIGVNVDYFLLDVSAEKT